MNYYNSIKEKFINNEINRKIKNYSINNSDLVTYYEVGRLLIEAQGGESRAKYGDGLIKEYSKKLMYELDKKYNITLLKRIRKFYLIIEKGATLSHQLSWSCYQVELKVTELKKEHIGQIEVYMNYIDSNLKNIDMDKTIGIIICRENNEFIMGYCSDKRILSREFKII